jgi:putative hydroxymethylpyrimidine transport system permease protein
LRPLLFAAVTLGLWEAAVRIFETPAYLLPGPVRIGQAFGRSAGVIFDNAAVTLLEILLGLAAGIATGMLAAILMSLSPRLRSGVGPLLPIAQAIPVFAIAPLLVTWLGFGLAPKVVMSTLIIFFPVATALFEGLRRTEQGLLDIAALNGAGRMRTLALIRFPAALPSLAAGLRVAAGVAPIGAVVGEWVGSAAGLGHLMLHANARAQTDLVFACLLVLVSFALLLWWATDRLLSRLLHWAPETLAGYEPEPARAR